MHTDITIEDVKKVKGMENISDELAQEIVRSIIELSEILFHTVNEKADHRKNDPLGGKEVGQMLNNFVNDFMQINEGA